MRIAVVALVFFITLFLETPVVSARFVEGHHDSLCSVERSAARERFAEGKVYLPETRDYQNGPYVEEAFYVLFNVKAEMPLWNDVVGLPPSCFDLMMDTLIVNKFGKDAFERAQNYANNLKTLYPDRYGNDCFYSPTYIPNNDSLAADLRKVIRYPAIAKRDSVTGVVYLRLEIDTTGSVANATVVKSARLDLDSAAVEAAYKIGKFHVERRWGTKKAAEVIIPIKFSLQ